jgi:DNA uptake protein ComE-like DNA-binding protein
VASMKSDLKQKLEGLEARIAEAQPTISDLESLQKKTEGNLLDLLNTGTLSKLKGLKTIGDVRAANILKLREEIGEFKSLHDLKPVLKASQIENLCKANIEISFIS